MKELWELYNINDEKTGVVVERTKNTKIPDGMYHKAVDIWVTKPNGEILLTQRHPNKNWGLQWECNGGATILGENSIDSAQRELFEETGIKAKADEFILLGRTIVECCILDTYLVKLEQEVELKLQAEEVVDAKWVTKDELERNQECMVQGVWERYLKYRNEITSR